MVIHIPANISLKIGLHKHSLPCYVEKQILFFIQFQRLCKKKSNQPKILKRALHHKNPFIVSSDQQRDFFFYVAWWSKHHFHYASILNATTKATAPMPPADKSTGPFHKFLYLSIFHKLLHTPVSINTFLSSLNANYSSEMCQSRFILVPPSFLWMFSLLLKDLISDFIFDFTAAGVLPCGGRKTSPRTSTIVQFIFYFGPLRSTIIFWEFRNKWLV